MRDPLKYHRGLIEKLVVATPSLGARLVREEGIFSKAPADSDLNDLVTRLSPPDRELLARMLQDERHAGIFEVLVTLHEACVLDGLTLAIDSQEVPAEPYGYTMFEEYVTVLNDGSWSSMGG